MNLFDLPKKRSDAKQTGSRFYYTGKPCKNGHISKRQTDSGSCFECAKEGRIRRYHADIEKSREAVRKWRKENRDKYLESARRSESKKNATQKGRLENAISTGVHRGIEKGSKACRKTFDLLGYSLDELQKHLEKKFLPGMTWKNYGRSGWEIDHVTPRSAFNYSTPDDIDFKRCWALDNLQPLWESINRQKWTKIDSPFQPSLALQDIQ
ncbi:hypothetical protein ACXIUS_30290 [Bosea thiooxidans]